MHAKKEWYLWSVFYTPLTLCLINQREVKALSGVSYDLRALKAALISTFTNRDIKWNTT